MARALADDAMYERVLSKCWNKLIKDIDTVGLLDRMIEHEFFPRVKLRDLQETKPTSQQIRVILDAVASAGSNRFDLFKMCLTESDQEHIVNILDTEEHKLRTEEASKRNISDDSHPQAIDDAYDTILAERSINGIAEQLTTTGSGHRIAMKLGISEMRFRQVEAKHRNDLVRLNHTLLIYWLEKEGKSSKEKFEELVKACTDISRTDIADSLTACVKAGTMYEHAVHLLSAE